MDNTKNLNLNFKDNNNNKTSSNIDIIQNLSNLIVNTKKIALLSKKTYDLVSENTLEIKKMIEESLINLGPVDGLLKSNDVEKNDINDKCKEAFISMATAGLDLIKKFLDVLEDYRLGLKYSTLGNYNFQAIIDGLEKCYEKLITLNKDE